MNRYVADARWWLMVNVHRLVDRARNAWLTRNKERA